LEFFSFYSFPTKKASLRGLSSARIPFDFKIRKDHAGMHRLLKAYKRENQRNEFTSAIVEKAISLYATEQNYLINKKKQWHQNRQKQQSRPRK